jgi:hypothetical protein
VRWRHHRGRRGADRRGIRRAGDPHGGNGAESSTRRRSGRLNRGSGSDTRSDTDDRLALQRASRFPTRGHASAASRTNGGAESDACSTRGHHSIPHARVASGQSSAAFFSVSQAHAGDSAREARGIRAPWSRTGHAADWVGRGAIEAGASPVRGPHCRCGSTDAAGIASFWSDASSAGRSRRRRCAPGRAPRAKHAGERRDADRACAGGIGERAKRAGTDCAIGTDRGASVGGEGVTNADDAVESADQSVSRQ